MCFSSFAGLSLFFSDLKHSEVFFLHGHTVKEKKDGSLDTSKFYALKKYDPWFLNFFLFFITMGIFPIGLYATKDISSSSLSTIIAVTITCCPIFYMNYRLLSRNNKCEKYYDQFEHDAPQQRRKWQIITAITMFVLVAVFVLIWVLFIK